MMPTTTAARTARHRAAPSRLGRLGRLAVAAVACVPAAAAGAQGNVSTQGYGYPQGGTSVRTAATGGAFAEFDALTPWNPAGLAGLRRLVVTVQGEPELRSVRVGDVTERTRTQRMPLALLAIPLRESMTASVSVATLLDRTANTRSFGTAVIDGVALATDDRARTRGAANDLRTAIGWRVNDRVSVGAAGHLVVGQNVVAVSRIFADSLQFGSVSDSSKLVLFGTALTVGADVRVGRGVSLAGSWRRGNGFDASVQDSVVGSGRVPDRLGLSVRYDGIPGALFAAGVEHHAWSTMRGMGSPDMAVRDATNWHGGAEFTGPPLRGVPMLLRAGVARQQLPFGVAGAFARETRWGGGVGLPVAQDRASIDLSVQRANRTLAGSPVREAAWLIGFGLQVRP
jgi:hypothetical protein